MVKNNILKNYHLWSDMLLLIEGTEFKIPKKETIKEKNNTIYDSLTGTYVDPPLLYCHIVDLEIYDEDENFQYCKAVKCREVAY